MKASIPFRRLPANRRAPVEEPAAEERSIPPPPPAPLAPWMHSMWCTRLYSENSQVTLSRKGSSATELELRASCSSVSRRVGLMRATSSPSSASARSRKCTKKSPWRRERQSERGHAHIYAPTTRGTQPLQQNTHTTRARTDAFSVQGLWTKWIVGGRRWVSMLQRLQRFGNFCYGMYTPKCENTKRGGERRAKSEGGMWSGEKRERKDRLARRWAGGIVLYIIFIHIYDDDDDFNLVYRV
mmetsp:Transcript_2945/g.4266  ORF Transcript_2945/g.4266 Transcript_2945/m.4266 type:complete len:241 (+) Transcript_2945:851-1573(+)